MTGKRVRLPIRSRLRLVLAGVDNDTAEYGTSGPFEPWESDHTALVHVLWAARRRGLSLEDDADQIASMILRSRWAAARADAAARAAAPATLGAAHVSSD